jgi:4-aminobutyrate aminotransferase
VTSNVLEFTPPLTLTKDEASAGIALLDQTLTDVASGNIDQAALTNFAGW